MSDTIKPLPVRGYTGQSSETIELVNELKVKEEQLLRALDILQAAEGDAFDQRWIAMGRSSIQTGFMQIIRGIFKPQRIELD